MNSMIVCRAATAALRYRERTGQDLARVEHQMLLKALVITEDYPGRFFTAPEIVGKSQASASAELVALARLIDQGVLESAGLQVIREPGGASFRRLTRETEAAQ